VLISWLAAQSRHPLIPLIYQLTEPVLRPFKRLVPPLGGVDLSPLFALIALRFLLLLLGW
jgi:YggT family protein